MKKHLFITLLIFLLGAAFIYAESGHEITSKAELEKVSFEMKTLRKKSTEKMVVFSLTLKNTSNEPLAYSVIAVVDERFAGEGTIPHSSGKTVNPGESVTGNVAVAYDKLPSNFVFTIKDFKP